MTPRPARPRAEAERAVAARTARIAEIDSRRDLTAQYVGELQVAYDKIQQQLDREPKAARDAVAVPLLPFRGALDWPTTRPDQQPVRPGRRPAGRHRRQKRHRDRLDRGPPGPGRARRDGRLADAFTGFGTLVILDHGGNNYSLYGYLGSVSVQTGATVETGAELGRVGAVASRAAGALFRAPDRRSNRPIPYNG